MKPPSLILIFCVALISSHFQTSSKTGGQERISAAFAQGGMGPGPGMVHSTGGGASPWSVISHVVLTPAGNSGGTTSAINTTGAKLLVANVTGFSGATFPSISDSQGNTWTLRSSTVASGGCISSIYEVANPTISATHTFTAAGAASFGGIGVIAFGDTTGTATFVANQGGSVNLGTTVQASSGITSGASNTLFVSSVCQDGAAGSYSVDQGFTISDQLPVSGGVYVGSGLSYFIQSTAGALNPTWTFGGAVTDAATNLLTWTP